MVRRSGQGTFPLYEEYVQCTERDNLDVGV